MNRRTEEGTVVARGIVGQAVSGDPGLHAHEVCHEGRDGALEDGRVAPDHKLVGNTRLVGLSHNCNTGRDPVSVCTPHTCMPSPYYYNYTMHTA